MRLSTALLIGVALTGCGGGSSEAPKENLVEVTPAGGAAEGADDSRPAAMLSDVIIENYMRAADDYIRGNPDFRGLFEGTIPSTALPQPTSGLSSYDAVAQRYNFKNYAAFAVVHVRVWTMYATAEAAESAAARAGEDARRRRELERRLSDPRTPAADRPILQGALAAMPPEKAADAPAQPEEDELIVRRNGQRLRQWAAGHRTPQ
jgi:hypothetical protein